MPTCRSVKFFDRLQACRMKPPAHRERQSMRIRSAVQIEDSSAGAEPSNRERRIKAGYRRLFRGAGDEGRGAKLRGRKASGEGRKPKAASEIPESLVHEPLTTDHGPTRSSSLSPRTSGRPAAADYLSRFLCVGFALALAVTGCVGPRPLRGGKAVVTRSPGGSVQQTLTQSENPAQATKQDQETIKVRTYTVPAGSRIELSQMWEGERPREPKLLRTAPEIRAREDARPPGRQLQSTVNSGSLSTFTLSAPMPVVEREETRARTELGAAQKDVAREVGAKLSSLKGIVWVGVGLFVFGLASLVYPPLKVVIGSVTTSAAIMLGGVALMVLPTLVVGNELLILGGVALVVGAWFLAHRHGHLRGIVAASSGTQNLTPPPPLITDY
jgi:hypothetical protein